jgi:hypothetical protein
LNALAPIDRFKLTDKQQRQLAIQGSDAAHIMSYGGSRSGKTFGNVRTLLVRAIAKESRHAIMRYRFNAVRSSIIADTFPKVMSLCFPEIAAKGRLNQTEWFYALPTAEAANQGPTALKAWSEVWFGGLDGGDRTEKILGMEFATVFLNECSQIPWASRNLLITRLAQRTGLRLKAYYDCNPPGMGHWTYRLFIEKRDPDRRQGVPDPLNYASIIMNPMDNLANVAPEYLAMLDALPAAQRNRFLLGLFANASESQLWSVELLDQQRILDSDKVPAMVRIVIAVDPSGASGEEDVRSDEIGLVVAGLGIDGRGYVLEDLSGRMSPEEWGRAAVAAYDRWDADAVVAEVNFGGDMVAAVVRAAAADKDRLITLKEMNAGLRPLTVPVTKVTASRSKVVRAEPISTLFEQQKVSLVGHFPEIEDQLVAFTTAGYTGSKSPDRADAMIWALSALFSAMTKPEENATGTRINRSPRVNLGHAGIKARLRGRR